METRKTKWNWNRGVKTFALFLLALIPFVSSSQGINATVVITPPFSPYMDEIANEMPLISLTNPSSQDLTIALRVKLTNGIQYAQTKEQHYSDEIFIPAGQTRVLNKVNFNYRSILGDGAVDHNISDEQMNNFINTRILPEGNYSYCIYAYEKVSFTQYEPLSINGMPAEEGLCSYIPIVFSKPPIITSPMSNSGQNVGAPITFNWTQPTPIASLKGIRYNLYLVKLEEDSDPEVEMQNTFYNQANYHVKIADIKANVHTFIPQSNVFRLEVGKKYAAMVQAVDINKKSFLQNEGKSEVITFHYNTTTGNLVVFNGTNVGGGSTYTGGPTSSKVTGRLVFRFKDASPSEFLTNYGNKVVEDNMTYNYDATPLYNATPYGNKPISLITSYLFTGTLNGVPVTNYYLDADLPIVKEINNLSPNRKLLDAGKVVGTGRTSLGGDFSITTNSVNREFGLIEDNFVFVGVNTSLHGKLYKAYRLKVNDQYLCSPDVNILAKPMEEVNVGTFVSYIKSYNLEVETKETFYDTELKKWIREGDRVGDRAIDGKHYTYDAAPAFPIGNIPVHLLRDRFITPTSLLHKKEGEVGDNLEFIQGKFNNKVKSNNEGIALFKHLILHDPMNLDDYFKIKYVYNGESGDKIIRNEEIVFSETKSGDFPYNRTAQNNAIVWNSDLEITTYRAELYLKYNDDIMISGKVQNAEYADSKVLQNAVVTLDRHISNNNGRTSTHIENHQQQTTDANGLFTFHDFGVGEYGIAHTIRRSLNASYPGFYAQRRPTKGTIAPLKVGQHLFDQIISLTPAGILNAYVEDEFGRAVEADIDVAGFGTETTKLSYKAGSKFTPENGGTFISNSQQIVSMKAPTGLKKIVITPLDKAYEPTTVTMVIPADNSTTMKRFLVHKAQKRVKFRVIEKSDVANLSQVVGGVKGKVTVDSRVTKKPIANAKVSLNRVGRNTIIAHTDQEGYVTFIFDDSGGDFVFDIESPSDKNYVNQTFQVTDVENSTTVLDFGEVGMPLGLTIKGKVTYGTNKKVLANATVFIDLGNGTRLETKTNSTGNYELKGVEQSYSNTTIYVSATKTGMSPALITQRKLHNLKTNKELDFNLQESEIALAKIWGFDYELKTSVKQSDGSFLISGNIVNISANNLSQNFKLKDAKQIIPFSNVAVKTVTAYGQKLSSIKDDVITTSLKELELILHNELEVVQLPVNTTYLTIKKGSGSLGEITGKIAVTKSSFHFSESHFKFNTSGNRAFYLTEEKGSKKVEIMTLKANTSIPKKQYGIKGLTSDDVLIVTQGFSGIGTNKQSFIDNGTIKFDLELKINALPNLRPPTINLQAGIINITKSLVETSENNSTVYFDIEKWKFEGNGWSFATNRSAIVIPSGIIKTGSLDIPVSDIEIRTNNLTIGDFEINGLKLGGIIDVEVASNDYTFGYNPSTSDDNKPHYEIRIKGNSIQPGVVIKNIYGLSNDESIKFQEMSLYSNNYSKINPGTQESFSLFYDVIKAKPLNFEEKDGYVIMNSEIDLDLPNTSTVNGKIKLAKVGLAIIATLEPLEGVSFNTSGGVSFKGHYPYEVEQKLTWGNFEYSGKISNSIFNLNAQLIRQKNKAQIKIHPEDQSIDFGTGIGLENVKGSTKVDFNKNEWLLLKFDGDMYGFEGIEADNNIEFEVNGEVNAKTNSQIRVKNVASVFKGIRMKMIAGGLRGNLSFDKEIFGMKASGTTDFIADKNGWYFISTGRVNAPIFGNTTAGMLLGAYNARLPQRDVNTLMKHAYDKILPAAIRNNFNGFYATGLVNGPISVPDIGFDFGITSAKLGVRSGLDLRVWKTFRDNTAQVEIGAMAFLKAYFKLKLDIGLADLTISSTGSLEGGLKGRIGLGQNSGINLSGCSSFAISGVVTGCAFGECDTWRRNFSIAAMFKLGTDGISGRIINNACSGSPLYHSW